MSSRRNSDASPEVTLPITPMLDMTFQLLTFFIMTFKAPSRDEALDLFYTTPREERETMLKLPDESQEKLKDPVEKDPSHQAPDKDKVDPRKEAIKIDKIEWEKVYQIHMTGDNYEEPVEGQRPRQVDISKVSFEIRSYNRKDNKWRPRSTEGEARQREMPIDSRRMLPAEMFDTKNKETPGKPIELDNDGRRLPLKDNWAYRDQPETARTKEDLKKAVETAFKEHEKEIDAEIAADPNLTDDQAKKDARERKLNEKLVIRIDAERTVPWSDIIAIQDVCQQAGVPRERILFVPPKHWPKLPPEKK
jgi:biopolymer transport protein ExbD